MPTTENLKEAFAGESQANRKYLAFAKKAEAEGYPNIAHLFRAAAEAETIHALSHLRVLGGIKGTAENLKAAVEGEAYEFQEMYPKMTAAAKAENNQPAYYTFSGALAVEKVHHELYSRALNVLQGGADLPQETIHVCAICGNTVVGEAPDKCPVCGAGRDKFYEVK